MESAVADGDTSWRCDRCRRRYESTDEAEVVELRTDEERDDARPDAWLCARCYEQLVVSASVTPVRVTKTDGYRTVLVRTD